MKQLSAKRKLLLTSIGIVAIYVVTESIFTMVAWWTRWGTNIWLFEDSARTWRFDPVIGHRLTQNPSRWMRITNGNIVYCATVEGNVQGFADRRDFTVEREGQFSKRFLVLGDSFTAGRYLGQNWPARAEDLTEQWGRPVRFMNFAIDGGGLANWWSVLTKIIEPEKYQADGMIFAIFYTDLWRKFQFVAHEGYRQRMFGIAQQWDPRTYPRSIDEARKYLRPSENSYILPPRDFERALQGEWPQQVPRRLRPIIMRSAWSMLNTLRQSPEIRPPDDPDRERLIADFRRFIVGRRIPAYVVYIPKKPSLLDLRDASEWPFEDARRFAGAIGATFLDGRKDYEGLNRREIQELFLPYDGHWNQAGSNRFAEFILQALGDLAR